MLCASVHIKLSAYESSHSSLMVSVSICSFADLWIGESRWLFEGYTFHYHYYNIHLCPGHQWQANRQHLRQKAETQ